MAFMTKQEFENYISSNQGNSITEQQIDDIKDSISPLIGTQFNILSIPEEILIAFEPSQIGTIIGSLMDACIPQLSKITEDDAFNSVGLTKNEGILGERRISRLLSHIWNET